MIELRPVQKVIASRTELAIAALTVHPGEVVAVVGPTGSGEADLLAYIILREVWVERGLTGGLT